MAKWMHEFVRMGVCSVDNPDMLVEVQNWTFSFMVQIASAGAGNFGQHNAGGGCCFL